MQYLIQNYMPSHVFLPIITRDTPNVIPKPDPAGILHIAREWGLTNRAENLIMVSIYFASGIVDCDWKADMYDRSEIASMT